MKDLLLRGPGYDETQPVATASWMTLSEIKERIKLPQKTAPEEEKTNYLCYSRGSLLLGETVEANPELVGWRDDRHVVTIAGSRAGKGRSAIIPNLWFYPGSTFCIDPKGENAAKTAEHRAANLGQQVYVLDPFRVSGLEDKYLATYNPLEAIDLSSNEVLEQIASIADSLVVESDSKNAHWDESARSLIQALIVHVLTGNIRGRSVSLTTVRELLKRGDQIAADERTKAAAKTAVTFPGGTGPAPPVTPADPFVTLLDEMRENEALDGLAAAQAHKLSWMGAEERGSILSFAERNTKFLDGQSMQMVLQRSLRNLNLDHLKTHGRGISVYLCLPARYMASHARWLRLILNALMFSVESNKELPKTGLPILAVLDEFPILGNLKIIETAVGFMAGFGLKLWFILQDINQLKRDYPDSWETFLGNAGVKQFFGNTDYSTLEYISKSLGETEVVRPIEEISNSESTSETTVSDAQRRLMREEAKKQGIRSREIAKTLSDNQISNSKTVNNRMEYLTTPLMPHYEIARKFRRENNFQIILAAGEKPMILKRINHDSLCDKSKQVIQKCNENET